MNVIWLSQDSTDQRVGTSASLAFFLTVETDDPPNDERSLLTQIRQTSADFQLIHTMPTFTFRRIVQISDLTNQNVAHAEFPSQLGFGLVGHGDDMGTSGPIDRRLGWSAELRALNDDRDAGLLVLQTLPLCNHTGHVAQTRANTLSDVSGDPIFKNRGLASPALVDGVVHKHQHTRFISRRQTAHSGHGDHIGDAELLESNKISEIVDLVRWRLVPRAMPRQKNHLRVPDLALDHEDQAEMGGVMPPVRHFLEPFEEPEGSAPDDAIFTIQLILRDERTWRRLSTDLLC